MRLPMLMSAALLLLSTAANAAPGDDETIVVTGKAMTRGELRKSTSRYVYKALANTVNGQVARWNGPICPRIIGLRDASAGLIGSRITRAATALKIPVAATGCKPNIVVFFVPDAAAMMRIIADKRSEYLGEMTSTERRRLIEAKVPVRWFYNTIPQGADGQVIDAGGGAGGVGALAGLGDLPTLAGGRSSRLDAGAQLNLLGATVIVDAPLADGTSLEAIAAYTIMVTLARTRFGIEAPPPDSIMSLFNAPGPDGRPADLSPMDEAFLFALYAAPATQWGTAQRAIMVNRIVTSLETGKPIPARD
ncbi:MAG: hypothetical protein ACOYLS_02820 [Polymorphobacter sp.]